MLNSLPRGAIPSARHLLAAALPYEAAGVTPPNFIVIPPQLSFWGNQTYGDCVSAEEAFAKSCYHPEIFITEETVVSWARTHNYLNGAVIFDVLETMATVGIDQDGSCYLDGVARAVDWTDPASLQNAIANGPVKIGIAANQLDPIYRNHPHNGWVATGFNPDSREDHCVSLCGFGSLAWLAAQLGATLPPGLDGSKPGYALFTWDTIGIIDEPSMRAITHEAWVRNPTSIIQ